MPAKGLLLRRGAPPASRGSAESAMGQKPGDVLGVGVSCCGGVFFFQERNAAEALNRGRFGIWIGKLDEVEPKEMGAWGGALLEYPRNSQMIIVDGESVSGSWGGEERWRRSCASCVNVSSRFCRTRRTLSAVSGSMGFLVVVGGGAWVFKYMESVGSQNKHR